MSMPITSSLDSAMYVNNLKFPVKLHKMLCDPLLSDIMIWMPCGQAWKILDSGELFEEVIAQSKYFNSSTPFGIRYSSFMRQVSYWGFTRIKSGRNKDCYFNKLFKRDSPHLLFEMKRGPNRRSKKDTQKNTPKQEAGKQVASQNVSRSSPDGVTTQTADNGHAFSSSTNLKKNCFIAAPVIYEQQKENNEGTSKDENKVSSYQEWCKERYFRHVNQEHVDEKLDVVKPPGPEREKETQQKEEQNQTTQIAATREPDFISSLNSVSGSSSDSNSETPKIYQLFKEQQKQKKEEQEAQKALSSTNTQHETRSSVSRSREEKLLVSATNEGQQQELLRKSKAQSSVSSSSGYGGFNLVNSTSLNSSLLLPPQQDHQLQLHMQSLNEMSLRNDFLREEVRMGFLQRAQQMQLQKQIEYHEAMVQLNHLEQMARFQY